MRYRTQSANVLNEASRFQAILDWQLFTHEQNEMLWGPSQMTKWKPGDPIYEHPHFMEPRVTPGGLCGCSDCNPDAPLEGYYGNCVRPMIQVMEDGENYQPMVCKDCDVSWKLDHNASQCWVCGAEHPGLKRMSDWLPKARVWQSNPWPVGSIFDIETVEVDASGLRVEAQLRDEIAEGLEREIGNVWRERMQQMLEGISLVGDSLRGAAASIRGLSAHYTITDEMRPYTEADVGWSQRLWLNANTIEPYHPPARALSPFERPEAEYVEIEAIPDFYLDPSWGEPVSYRRTEFIRRMLSAAGPKIFERPAPEVPKLNFDRGVGLLYNYQGNYARSTINTPITEQRRRRNL